MPSPTPTPTTTSRTPPDVPDVDEVLSDEGLALLIRHRDRSPTDFREAVAAFETLYERHAHRLLGYLAARCRRDDLDDLHQNAWQRVWQHVGSKFHGGNFRAWLHQIARNLLVDESRRPRIVGQSDGDLVDDGSDSSPDRSLLESERREVLRRCLERLDEETAEIVRARLGGESYESICERSQLAASRAHKLFHRAKEQLTSCFERSYR